MFNLLKQNSVINILSIGFLTLAMILAISPDFITVSAISYYIIHFMLGYLALALLFLIMDKKRLMFAALASCGILCIFLKKASNQHIVLPETNNLPSIDIAHFNLNNVQENRIDMLNQIKTLNPDIISFQEFTPDWNEFFDSYPMKDYEYFSKDVRIDPYGICIFSKYPIKNAKLYYHNDIPNFQSHVEIDELKISIFSSYLLPPFSPSGKIDSKAHIDQIVRRVNDSEHPNIIMGDFNMVYWASEIRQFRSDAELSNSRREINFATATGLKKIPYDHIFFSSELECTTFKDLVDEDNNHIGIYGAYQVQSEDIIEIGASSLSISY